MSKKVIIRKAKNTTPQLAKSVAEYIECLGDRRGEIVDRLRSIVTQTVPQCEESMCWGQAVYELNGPFCFIKAFRNQVNLGFWRGDQIADPKKLLNPSSDSVRFVILTEIDEKRTPAIRELVKSAVKLNRQCGDPTKPR